MPPDDVAKILADEKVFFARGHLDAIAQRAFTSVVQDLGGEVVSEQDAATITIINPGSPHHKPITGNGSSSQENAEGSDGTKAIQMPYHWLAQCRLKNRRLALDELKPATPFMQHTGATQLGTPLHIYVSKNVLRDPGQLELPVWKIVGDDLAAAGAIIVAKRSEADILVVDRKSFFYKNTIKPEIQRYNRTHQRVAERSWVDECLAQGKFLSLSVGEEQQEKQQQDQRHVREDSFAEEEEPVVAPKNKGGRPVGKPRTEYTPEDDDFLCRYLAAYHPKGAWTSRKTYELMMMRVDQFPIVERHTQQSWHERFKKNATPFERRLQRFIDEGINDQLLTADERKREREKRAKQTADALTQGNAGEGSMTRRPEAPPASSSKGKERAAPSPAKRKLAEVSDDDSATDAAGPERIKQKLAQVSQPVGRTARIEALGPAPDVITEPTALTAAAGSLTQAEAGAADDQIGTQVSFEPDLDILPAEAPLVRKEVTVEVVEKAVEKETVVEAESVSVAVTETEAADEVQEKGKEKEKEPSPAQPIPERAPTPRTSTPTPRIPAASPRTPAPPGRAVTPKSAPAPVATPQQRTAVPVPSTAPPQLSPQSRPVTQSSVVSPSRLPSTLEVPPAQRPRTPETSQTTAETTTTPGGTQTTPRALGKRQRVPVTMPSPLRPLPGHERRTSVEAGPARRALEDEIAAAQQQRRERFAKQTARALETISSRPAARSAAPGDKYQANVQMLSNTEKVAEARAAQSQELAQAQAQAQGQTQPQPKPQPTALQPPAEILTPAQRAERVAAGQQTVLAQKELYRQRIAAYTTKYGVSIGELLKIVAEVTRGMKGEMYWDAVDRGLRAKFGF